LRKSAKLRVSQQSGDEMDQEQAIIIARALKEKAQPEFKPEAVYLYGSYAKGTPQQESDIDIAFIYDQYHGSFLKDMARLIRISHEIDIRIEPVIVDRDSEITGFLSEIRNTGVLII